MTPPRNQRPVEVAALGTALVGEGPVWDSRHACLYWVDIKGQAVLRFDPATGRQSRWPVPERIGALIPCRDEGFVAVTKSGLVHFDVDLARCTWITNPEPERSGNRFNDAKCDSQGRLWAGTMDDAEVQVTGALYRFDSGGQWLRMQDDLHLPNGLGWSPDDRVFYLTDSLRRAIYAYDFDVASGTLRNQRVFASIPPADGYPDGLAVDAQGNVWSAHWGGWRLTRYAPDGSIREILPMPVPQPSSCAFGGPALRDLYITSAAIDLDVATRTRAPLSGSLFVIRDAGAGVPVAGYRR